MKNDNKISEEKLQTLSYKEETYMQSVQICVIKILSCDILNLDLNSNKMPNKHKISLDLEKSFTSLKFRLICLRYTDTQGVLIFWKRNHSFIATPSQKGLNILRVVFII